jgi:hypothetical protein
MFDDNLFLNDPRSTLEMGTTFLQPAIFSSLPASDQLFLWRRARAVAIWNQRAALLKALDNGLRGTQRSEAERDIALINNWFARQHYDSNIEAATGQTVTPILNAARLKTLVEQNSRAAQDIATAVLAGDLVRIGTDLANIARGNIGGVTGAAAEAPPDIQALSGLPPARGAAGQRWTSGLLALGLVAGAALALGLVGRRPAGRNDQRD